MKHEEEEEKDTNECRNWSDLPEVLLLSVLDRLLTVPDVLAFASVCSSWRPLAQSNSAADRTSHLPPLLLHCPVPLDVLRREAPTTSPRECRFRILSNDLRSYRTGAARGTLSGRCVGCSYGHLIVVLTESTVVLVDAFTGEEIAPPDIGSPCGDVTCGILTAPLSSSSSCMLLLTTSRDDRVMCWLPGSDEWHASASGFRIRSLAPYGGQVYCLDSDNRLVVLVDFSPRIMNVKKLGSPFPSRPLPCIRNFNNYHLVGCGTELLLLLFVSAETSWMHCSLKIAIEVYRFDFAGMEWARVDSLGDRCLFVDPVGRSPLSCRNPTRWGGRSNCVYVAGPGCDAWSVFPLDGSVIDAAATTNRECPLSAANWSMRPWPSPVWVYPSTLF